MSLLKEALLKPSSSVNRSEMCEMERRGVIVHQNVIIQEGGEIPQPVMTSIQQMHNAKSFLNGFNPNHVEMNDNPSNIDNVMATHTQNLDESLPNLSQTVVSNILEMEETYSKNMGSPHSSIIQNSSDDDLERRKRKKMESDEKIMKKAKKSKKSTSKSPSRRRHKAKHEKRDKVKSIKVREMEVIAGPSTSLHQVPEYDNVSAGSTPPPTVDLENSDDWFSFMRSRRDKFLEMYHAYNGFETEYRAKKEKLVELEEQVSLLKVECEQMRAAQRERSAHMKKLSPKIRQLEIFSKEIHENSILHLL
ncbi:uncharacterized protein [Leptinotarsa decemlineata]|uniref:uncharacterized protein n=1 Tax=Leptinotarsa decemlineata TaxID=7539 RepID=UPI003D3093A8